MESDHERDKMTDVEEEAREVCLQRARDVLLVCRRPQNGDCVVLVCLLSGIRVWLGVGRAGRLGCVSVIAGL